MDYNDADDLRKAEFDRFEDESAERATAHILAAAAELDKATGPQRSDPDAEDAPATLNPPSCDGVALTDGKGKPPRYCTLPLGHEGECVDAHGSSIPGPESRQPAAPPLADTADPGYAERMKRLHNGLPSGVRVVKLSELAADPDGAKILATLLGYDCGEGDACEQAEDRSEQATPRPAGALDARVRILCLPVLNGVMFGTGRAPFVLVVDRLGTLKHVGAQEAFWTEHGKAMGAVRTIVAAGIIDLDDAQL